MKRPKVALVHDWLTGMRGGESILEALSELFPDAEIFTLFHVKGSVSPQIEKHPIHTSRLDRIPGMKSRYRMFLPLFPSAAESFDLTGFDLILSSSHCVAKGIRKPKGSIHLSYVHAPMRYVWSRYEDYFGKERASLPVRMGGKIIAPWLRNWDRKSSARERVDGLIANSKFIADEIREVYGRDATVIHPFVDSRKFASVERKPEDAYLIFGALAPNKRVDLAIRALQELGKSLWIAGSGQDETRLKAIAGPETRFFGSVTDREILDLFSRAKALLFPGVEDFGIVPLEAMAAGLPVIAFGKGGALETVTDKTGIFFRESTTASLKEAILRFEKKGSEIDGSQCKARAAEFSREKFLSQIKVEIGRYFPLS